MPILFLLATKNNLLSVIVGKSYVKLNFLHRFAGRCITACSILHSGLYIKRECHTITEAPPCGSQKLTFTPQDTRTSSDWH